MGAHVLFLHAVQTLQRRLVASYKKQLGWDEGRAEGAADTAPRTDRKPIFTVLALAIALATAVVSVNVISGAPSGYGGWGAVLAGVLIGFLGTPVAIAFCLVALIREKRYLWVNLASMVICLAFMLWLYNHN